MARLLAELGANVNTAHDAGCTPAFIAAQEGHTEAEKALAELGANMNNYSTNINTPRDDGCTPANIAAQPTSRRPQEGHVGVLKLLAELGRTSTRRT